jgi:hypothetical protein
MNTRQDSWVNPYSRLCFCAEVIFDECKGLCQVHAFCETQVLAFLAVGHFRVRLAILVGIFSGPRIHELESILSALALSRHRIEPSKINKYLCPILLVSEV